MKNKLFLILFLIGLFGFSQEERDIEYIKKHAYLAVQEMELYKIPASITLSQGILETGGGQSRLAEMANNHFGIKCKKEWTGDRITHDDDAPGECFRKYKSVEESYRDHSKFLAERPYYKKLFTLPLKDYKAWAHGLKKAGYATNPKYAPILISRIEKYNLNQFDGLTKEQVYDKLVELFGETNKNDTEPKLIVVEEEFPPTEVEKIEEEEEKQLAVKDKKPKTKTLKIPTREINAKARIKRHAVGQEYIVVMPGETLNQLSKTYKVSTVKLMKYNELDKAQQLKAGQNLFLGKKKNKGSKKYYTVVDGDNMNLISQKTGIKLKKLYKYNRLEKGQEPYPGERMYLRGKRPKR